MVDLTTKEHKEHKEGTENPPAFLLNLFVLSAFFCGGCQAL
jgi:hypothetical protein